MDAVTKYSRALILAFILASFTLALIFAPAKAVSAELIATQASPQIVVDGENIPFDAFNIEGSNYFKLRDLAYALDGSPKSFEVSWNSDTKTILLTGGQPYTPVGGEMSVAGNAAATPLPNAAKVFFNGRQILLTSYVIEGNTYFKLRDIAQALDFSVEWDEQQGVIIIDTHQGYGKAHEAEAIVPLAQSPLPITGLGGQKIGEALNEDALGEPRRIITEDTGTQLRLYGDYSRFTLICISDGKVVYIYVNYDNHSAYAEKLFTDNNDSGKAYAATAGQAPFLDTHATEQMIFELTNAFRGYHSITPLRWNDTLGLVARAHSQDMAQRNFFSHVSPDGTGTDNRLTKAGYQWRACAENIVAGYQNAVDAIDVLINSAPHRKNMLTTNCNEMGAGWIKTDKSKYTFYGTQVFGRV